MTLLCCSCRLIYWFDFFYTGFLYEAETSVGTSGGRPFVASAGACGTGAASFFARPGTFQLHQRHILIKLSARKNSSRLVQWRGPDKFFGFHCRSIVVHFAAGKLPANYSGCPLATWIKVKAAVPITGSFDSHSAQFPHKLTFGPQGGALSGCGHSPFRDRSDPHSQPKLLFGLFCYGPTDGSQLLTASNNNNKSALTVRLFFFSSWFLLCQIGCTAIVPLSLLFTRPTGWTGDSSWPQKKLQRFTLMKFRKCLTLTWTQF